MGAEKLDLIAQTQDSLALTRGSVPTVCMPTVCQPCLGFVVQGRKRALLNDEVFHYDALNYLVVSVTLPMMGQVLEATTDRPFLSLRLDLDLEEIARLLLELGDRFFRLLRLLVIDPEIKPGVRKRWIEALYLFEERDAFSRTISVELREGIVEFVADRIGREVERLLEFGNCLGVRGRVFEESLAQITVAFDDLIGCGGGGPRKEPDRQRGCEKRTHTHRPEGSRDAHRRIMA